MTVANLATQHTKKLMKFTLDLFRRGFNSSKCKTAAKMAVARIKLLRNKREVVVRQMRRDIAVLLQSGQDSTARIRVEHVIREQNVLAANEIIELFCDLVVSRLTIIAKQKECPADLKEGIASLIFAAPRCSEIPELGALRKIFEKKYGADFTSAAMDLRPSCGVNRMLIDKLSVRTPSGEVKLKIMKEIAKEHQIQWDTAESEEELLKPSEELLGGQRAFVSASSLPVDRASAGNPNTKVPAARSQNNVEGMVTHYEDTTSAAEAATELAKKAIAAAQAAAFLANNDKHFTEKPMDPPEYIYSNRSYLNDHRYANYHEEAKKVSRRYSYNGPSINSNARFDESNDDEESTKDSTFMENRKVLRRHSYNNCPSIHSDVKFDESDTEEEMEVEVAPPQGRRGYTFLPPPDRPPPSVPSFQQEDSNHCTHPKLPDYEKLAARFEALKTRKSQG